MNGFDENSIGMATCWASPSSPSPRTLLAMLNQADNNGHVANQISEIFPQTNHRSEQRSGLGERVAARIEFNLTPLQIPNNRPFAALFRNPPTTVPSPLVLISPGFSPSAMLQFPNMFFDPSQTMLPSPVANCGPPEAVESSGADHAAMKISNNDPMHVALPPQQDSIYIPSHVDSTDAPIDASFESGPAVNETDLINMEIERENRDDEEYKEDDHNIVDDPDAEPSSPKRSKLGGSTMIGATRSCKSQRVILQVETEESNPDDGFRWRKYGQKVVKGNPNARSYYKCTNTACNVKKHVERGAEDVKFLLITYDGTHEHDPPAPRGSSSSGLKSRYSSSVSEDYNNHRTVRLGRPPSLFSAPQAMSLFPSSLDPPMDMTQFYMTGLAKLPSLPDNQNHGLMNQNDEPKVERVIPDGTEVFKGIRDRLNLNFGLSL